MIRLIIKDSQGKECAIQYDDMLKAETAKAVAEGNGCKCKILGNGK